MLAILVEQIIDSINETMNKTALNNADQYCLKWSDFSVHVVEILFQLLKTQSMVDVTLCADGKKIFAHRAVLCAHSSYFKDILSEVDDPHPVVILTEISAQDVKSILEFLYCGEFNVDSQRVSTVMKAAESLQIRPLMEVGCYLRNLSPRYDSPSADKAFRNGSTISSVQLTDSEVIEMPVEMEVAMSIEISDSFGNIPQQDIAQQQNSDILESNKVLQVPEKDSEQYNPQGFCQNGTLSFREICEPQEEVRFEETPSTEKTEEKLMELEEKKQRKRRENIRKDYSEEQLKSALADLRAGRFLRETAVAHRIPRSTLYVRAKAAGVPIALTRQEHSAEQIRAALDAVEGGASLQQASTLYQIPKTVLWRRFHSSKGHHTMRQKHVYSLARRQAAVQALQNGQTLSRVCDQFQIPKTTLFREKARLVESGKLPWNSLRRTNPRLREAVSACQEGKMTQALASATFQVPKTTIWRRLKKKQSSEVEESANSEISAPADSELQKQISFTFCEASDQIPIACIVDDSGTEFSGESIIL